MGTHGLTRSRINFLEGMAACPAVDVLAFVSAWETQTDKVSESLRFVHEQMAEQRRLVRMLLAANGKGECQAQTSFVLQESGFPKGCSEDSTSESVPGTSWLVAHSEDIQAARNLRRIQNYHDMHVVQTEVLTNAYAWLDASICSFARDRPLPFCVWAPRLVNTTKWQLFSGFVILMNVLWIGYTAHVSMAVALASYDGQEEADESIWMVAVDCVFLLLFFGELVVVLLASLEARSEFLKQWRGHGLDIFVVIIGVTEISFTLCGFRVDFFRLFRLLKLARVGRLAQILRHVALFRKLRLMISALAHSGMDLFWASTLLLSISFCFSILFVHIISLHVNVADPADEAVEELRAFFSSMPRAILTCVMCVTGGVSWWEVIRPFIEISWFLASVFVFFIFIMVVAALNVVTGIFVTDAMTKAETDRDMATALRTARKQALRVELLTLFKDIDANHSGGICLEEFEAMMERDDLQALLSNVGIEVANPAGYFKALDVDGSGEISLEEFIIGCTTLAGQSKQLDMFMSHAELKDMIVSLREKVDGVIHVNCASILKELKTNRDQFTEQISGIDSKLSFLEMGF